MGSAIFGAILGLSLAAGAAGAAEPIPLAPGSRQALPDGPGAPRSQAPAALAQGIAAPDGAINEDAAPDGAMNDDAALDGASKIRNPIAVDIAPLGTVDPNSLGLLDVEAGGLGLDLWKETDGALVARLLPRLPAAPSVPAMRALQRRLLLSTAAAPGNGKLQTDLLPLRIERLAAMGETAALVEFLRIIPGRAMTESMVLSGIESRFLLGDRDAACKIIREFISDYQGAHWQRLLIFCEALAGEADAVQFGLALLGEMPGKSKPVFFQLINAILGKVSAQISSLPDPSPLEIAMIGAAKRQVPPDAGATTGPAILRAIATNEQALLALRLDTGERAEAAGALAPGALGALYGQVPGDMEAIGAIDKAATQGPLGRGLLVQAANKQTDPQGQAQLLQRLWQEARATDETGATYGTAVRVTLPMLREISPSLSLAWFAPDAGKALLLGGDYDAAAAWLAQMEAEADQQIEAAKARDALWPFVKLADANGALAWDAARLEAWWKTAGADKAKGSLLFGLLAAMGEPMGAPEWARVLDGAPRTMRVVPSAAIWNALGEASAKRRVGETLLLALLSLGDAAPGQVAPMTLEGVLAALRRTGLGEEARRLAIEAALMQGL